MENATDLCTEAECFLTCMRIPHLHRSIVRRSGETIAVWAEGDMENATDLCTEAECFLTCMRIPHLHRSIVRRSGETIAVWAESRAIDRQAVSHILIEKLSRSRIPNSHPDTCTG